MFTLQSFSIFFWTLASIIVLMLIFEDKMLMIEAKYDKRKAQKKAAKADFKQKNTVKSVKTVSVSGSKRPQNRYAA